MNNSSERGNVFFTLFGAVAIVGVLGAGIMATMRGPLQTIVNVNQREQAKSEMQIAARLVLLETANSISPAPDCDSDGYMEPLEYVTNASGPTGGGDLPAVIASNKIDPWGTEYGYCAWDLGPVLDDAGCGGGTQNRLSGPGLDVETPFVMAVISAGPDKTFQTTCSDDPTYITKSSGADDLVFDYTYGDAVGATGGLWKIQSGAPDTAEIDKNLDVMGGATFSGGGSFGDLVSFTGAGGIILPDQTATGGCGAANDGVIRRNTTGSPPDIEICENGSGWIAVAGPGATTGGKWSDGATTGEIYYNTGNVGIGLTDPNFLLDVAGTFNVSDLAIFEEIDVTGLATFTANISAENEVYIDGNLTVDSDTFLGNTTINSATGVPLRVQNSGADALVVEADGGVAIGGGTASDALDVTGNIHLSGDVELEDDESIIWGAGTTNITATSTSDSMTFNVPNVATFSADVDVDGALAVSGASTLGNASTDTITANGDATFNNDIEFGVENLVVSGTNCTTTDRIMKYDGTDWICATDAGSGTGATGGQTLEETLLQGNSAGDEDAEGFNRLGLEQICNDDLSTCENYDDIRNADQIQGTNIVGTAVTDTTTTGQILVWNQTTGLWEVGDGTNVANVTATDIVFPIDVDGAASGIIMDINAGANNFLSIAGGTQNIFMGTGAGNDIETGGRANTAFGIEAALYLTTGDFNSFFGRTAGYYTTTGSRNSFFGDETGGFNTTGGNNSFFGYNAGANNTTASDNSFFGSNSGFANTTGQQNSFFGTSSGAATTTGGRNVFFGHNAGSDNTTGGSNVFLGWLAGRDNTTANYNIYIGASAGASGTTNGANTIIGWNAGVNNTSIANTFLGERTGEFNTSGQRNTFIGRMAGRGNTTGSWNIILGEEAGMLTPTSNYWLNIGNAIYGTMHDTVGDDLIGDGEADITIDGDLTVNGSVMGIFSGPISLPIDADDATSPAGVLIDINSGADNILSIAGTNNVFLGRSAGDSNTTGGRNSFFGSESGTNTTTGSNNVFVGQLAGYENTAGANNVYIGERAGQQSVAVNGNTFVGWRTGSVNTSGEFNTFVGSRAGRDSTTGVRNTFIGRLAGSANTTGSWNIVLGEEAQTPSPTTSYYLNIGNAIYGTMHDTSGDDLIGDGEADITIDGDLTVIGGISGSISLPIDADDATSPAGQVISINSGADNFLGSRLIA